MTSRPPQIRTVPRFSRHGLWVAPMVLAVTAVLGIAIKDVDLASLEIGVSAWMTAHQVMPLSVVAWLIAEGFSPFGALPLTVVIGAYLWWRRSWLEALWFVSIVFGGWGAAALIKPVVLRPRPDFHRLTQPLSPQRGLLSFPSGHTSFAVGFLVAVAIVVVPLAHRRLATIVAVIGVILVATSRVYAGAHFITDVIAGAVAGTMGVWFTVALWELLFFHWHTPRTVHILSK